MSTPLGATPRCVLIDCGKTFREVVLNLFPKHGLKEIGALLLTHGHADAILGMDDLRDVQQYEQVDPGVRFPAGPTHVYLHEATMQAVKLRFDYLCNKPVYLDEAKGILERPISYLKFDVIDVDASIDPDGVPIKWCVRVACGWLGSLSGRVPGRGETSKQGQLMIDACSGAWGVRQADRANQESLSLSAYASRPSPTASPFCMGASTSRLASPSAKRENLCTSAM